jgi:hypothetical protein
MKAVVSAVITGNNCLRFSETYLANKIFNTGKSEIMFLKAVVKVHLERGDFLEVKNI